MKKIALLGNMNNNHNSLTRYLRDAGFDAQLFLYENEVDHFMPGCDQYGTVYKEYTNYLKWGSYKSLVFFNKKKIKDDLKDFDFVIGSRLAPAILNKAGMKLDVAIPTGSDLYEFPFFQGYRLKNLLKYFFVSKHQRKGFEECSHLIWDETNPGIENKIGKIKFKGNRLKCGIPMIYLPEYTKENIQKHISESHLYSRFKKIRDENDIVIFHQTRHLWKSVPSNMPEHNKGNDRLFHAVKKLIDNNPNLNIAVNTFSYGGDVDESKKLIKDLGIEKYVNWFEKSPRKEIMIGIDLADIVAGQFKNCYYTYGSVLEGVTMKKVIIHNRSNEMEYKKKLSKLFPVIHAETKNDIYEGLTKYINNKEYYDTEVAKEAYNWLENVLIKKPVNYIIDAIQNKT
ncbi:hypothetical protein [Pontimicrobium sp. MEBiC06410]